MAQKLFLKLYISGNTLRSRRAIVNLQKFCDRELPDKSVVEIIDVMKFPKIAELEKILITPTLVKLSPEPQERIIGDLSNTEVLSLVLNLPHCPSKTK
ncbi:MAG TPA: circadian clock KaiB family protein [Coleofasciculaceae cyanobacterium]|jgi:circadian clock protein KaiB